MTRAQIRDMAPRHKATTEAPRPTGAVQASSVASSRPAVPGEIAQYFVPCEAAAPVYRPYIAGAAQVHVLDPKLRIDELREVFFLAPIAGGPVPMDWASAELCEWTANDLSTEPEPEARFLEVPVAALKPKQYSAFSKAFSAWLLQTQKLELWRGITTSLISRPGETEGEFRARNQQAARETRDQAVQKLRDRYAARVTGLADRLRRAEQAHEREQQQASEQRLNTALTIGTGVLGALFGRRSIATQGSAAARSMARSRREASDVQRAEETAEAVRSQLAELEARIESEIAELQTPAAEELERIQIRPKRTGIQVRFVALAWKS